MKINGVLVDNSDDIVAHVLEFYKDLFLKQSKIPIDYPVVAEMIPSLVYLEDNLNLKRMPSVE